MALGSRLYPNGTLQVPTYFDDYTTLTGASVRLTPDYYLAKTLDEVTISPLANGLAKREYSNGTLAVANSFDEITLSTYPSSTVPAFNAAVNRPMWGYYSYGRVGWSFSAEISSPTGLPNTINYDDGYSFLSQSVYKVITPGLSWYMGNTPYTELYVSTNGYVTFSAGYSAHLISGPQVSPSGIWCCPGDQIQGTNGDNTGLSTPSAIAYRKGITSTGWQFFSVNMQGYQYQNITNDRSWEINCFFNYDNSVQLVEMVYSPFFSSVSAYTGSAGISTGSSTFTSSTTPAAGLVLSFSSVDRGVTWTYAGQGSWGIGTF
jgi:hypothetical protein